MACWPDDLMHDADTDVVGRLKYTLDCLRFKCVTLFMSHRRNAHIRKLSITPIKFFSFFFVLPMFDKTLWKLESVHLGTFSSFVLHITLFKIVDHFPVPDLLQ